MHGGTVLNGGRNFTTASSLESIAEDAPGLLPLLEQATGKIVFLGNGHSNYPLHAVERFKRGELSHPPVIHDLFDYRYLQEGLRELRPKLLAAGFPQPPIFETVDRLVEAIEEETLIAVSHCIGAGVDALPPELLNAQLLVNVLGPSTTVLDEQVHMMTSDGLFYFTQIDSPLLTSERLPSNYRLGFLVKKRSCLIFRENFAPTS